MFASARKTVNLKGLFRLTIALCPPRCVLCQGAGQLEGGLPLDLCTACEAELPARAPGTMFAAHRAPNAGERSFAEPIGPRIVYFVPWRFESPVAELIRDLKFHAQPHHARVLGLLLARAVRSVAVELPNCLVPMPLHDARLAERGYNQSAEIAHYAGQALGLPLQRRWLRRVRATAEQSHLGARERVANVAGAFACGAIVGGPLLAGCPAPHIALIDDVVTTGSTALEAARTLHDAGAARVDVWAIARA